MNEASAYSLTFPAFIGLLGLLAWFLVQRQIRKNDLDNEKGATAVEARFKDHETRMNQHGDRLRQAELDLANKISREDLEKATDKFTGAVNDLRAEVKADLLALQTAVLQAISTNRHPS